MNEEDGALICPYCGKYVTHKPDAISTLCSWQVCGSCGKQFWYSVKIDRHYKSYTYEEQMTYLRT